MAEMKRWKEIRQFLEKWDGRIILYVSFLILALVLIARGADFIITSGTAHYGDEFETNIVTEMIGVVVSVLITLFIVNRFYEQRNKKRQTQELKERLIREARSRANDYAINAIEQLRDKGWLTEDDSLLKGARLMHANLEGAGLSWANLQAANLSGANLRGAHLWKANLQGAQLQSAKLQEAVLQKANLQRADFWQANLQEAKLREANLQRARFWEASLQEADLSGTNLQEADLSGTNLQKAKLIKANLQGANLRWANLQGANLFEANLQKAILLQTNLQKASFWQAKLQEAILREANLQGALLWEANLQEADLSGANLQEAGLRAANLENAILPDGTTYSEDVDMEKFTNPEHQDYQATLDEINKLRTNYGWPTRSAETESLNQTLAAAQSVIDFLRNLS